MGACPFCSLLGPGDAGDGMEAEGGMNTGMREARAKTRGVGGRVGEREAGGVAFSKAVAWTYCALMGWLSFLLPFFFAVEEWY